MTSKSGSQMDQNPGEGPRFPVWAIVTTILFIVGVVLYFAITGRNP